METKVTTQSSNAAVAAQDTTPQTPEAIVEQLRSLRVQIPDYVQLPVPSGRSIRTTAHVNSDFVQATINAAGASLILQTALGKTPDVLRQEAEEAARYTVLEDELKAMLKGVASANLIRRHRVGIQALQTYSISRQLVRTQGNADLLPHVAEMKRLNRMGRKRKAAQPQTPAPQPTPTPVPTAPAPHAGS
jgi:hypothetical protein